MTPRRADWVVMVVAPDETRRVWRFVPGEVRIGRDESCAVRLDDPEVSGVHLRLLLGDRGAVAHDPGSRNGTFRGGLRLPVGLGLDLAAGDSLAIGGWRIAVARDDGGGLTTDSRDFDLHAAALRTLRAEPVASAGTEPSPVRDHAPPAPPGEAPAKRPAPGDRLYTAALVIAGLGALLAAAALLRALSPD
ncbi:FHA domain-containing protein [Myxococcota bacterium]|nr:FHA domain-containing protein [Myxococcota bacterium]